ncbi:probable glutathione S-transferase [Salvia miltiorrhiza]|uniref:probable glutathione S-transferase n=1 Tax=Salvia miltiorrhiza TaxID=226208 RepID=UPI0025ABF9AE|nr:probable glutathione S-transferase [Salvia miltiorrhiza]
MSEVKVFGAWFSPYVRRVEMALDLKGVEYEFIEEDLKNKSALLLQYNPVTKLVPVLVHNGKPIFESSVILEYIDEVWEAEGPSILPKHPYHRAMARFWAKFLQEKCTDPMWKAFWSAGEEREKAKGEAEESLKILENEIKGKKFFGGDNIGFVDFVGNFLAFWIPILQEVVGLHILTQDKFPNICKWADEFCNDSFVKKHLPEKEKVTFGLKRAFETGSLY